MAEAAWKLNKSEDLIDEVNEQINQIDLNDSEETSKGTLKKTKRQDKERFVQSATTGPSSNTSTPSHSSTGLFHQNSQDNSFSQSKKFEGCRSKIPLRQSSSASDSLRDTTSRYYFPHNGGRYYHSIGKSSSSSSSQSSEATGKKINLVKDRFCRSSDSQPENGLVPYDLGIQNTAWSESNNSPSLGSVGTSQTPNVNVRVKSTRGSSRTFFPATPRDNSFRQHLVSSGRTFSQRRSKFDVYSPLCQVQQGLEKGQVIQGVVRINPRNYEDAFISAPDGEIDIYLPGIRARNRALNGDVVAVRLRPVEHWKIMWENIKEYEELKGHSIFDEPTISSINYPIEEEVLRDITPECSGWDQNYGRRMPEERLSECRDKSLNSISHKPNLADRVFIESQNRFRHHKFTIYNILSLPTSAKFVQKSGKVVYIIEKVHPRNAMGCIKLLENRNRNWALFSPADHRIPRIKVPIDDCPKGFYERPHDYATTLFIAKITDWEEDSMLAKGRLARSLGEAGQIEPETEGILLEHDVDFSEFSPEVLKDLPQNLPWNIPESELKLRVDFREDCVFTIDPKTARDLDDAISCKVLGENLLEVCVHIADVSYFIKDNTLLDKEASKRATSVYLVQKVVPMLPRLLCEDLCSLNPGQDRLTFSVVWKMNSEGEILDEWFGKTVIRSCVKLSYEHAQDMIENPDKEFQPNELPEITGGYTAKQICDIVQNLQRIAVNLRRKRFQEGALRLDQVKLQFSLDHETGLPNGYSIHELKDSNRMIEELMLLANMAVARQIYVTFPQKAFLRCHETPQSKMLDDVVNMCQSLGIFLDSSSAGALQESLSRYMGEDIFTESRVSVLTQLLSKPMKPATYFCSGWINDPNKFRHYALNVPLYTHFTSPIRRFPDIIVHRLLAASLEVIDEPSTSIEDLQKCATHCNQKKLNARRVNEVSCQLFLANFVKVCGPLREKAMVMAVADHSFDVLIVKMGVTKRIYCDKLDIYGFRFEKKMGVPCLTLNWKNGKMGFPQVLSLFSMVDVVLMSVPTNPIKFQAIMTPPISCL